MLSNYRQGWHFLIAAGLIIATIVIVLIIPAGDLAAHGVILEYTQNSSVEITARYDYGEPMSGAQVAVFAPGSPSEPWLTGTCDDSGKFSFVPDTQIPGLWEVQVRQAGHGDIIRIQISEGSAGPSGAGGFTTAQKIIMAAAVIWGLVGTALFFTRRRA
ncbi:MAG: carboxypeptidase regulatory-like domain-containing protein [Actinobacteria bacterium]|nr:carboxypeptidase regulatory-like domain-containing protein [Actinomycetota bacterium]